jgi:hypothetical protein
MTNTEEMTMTTTLTDAPETEFPYLLACGAHGNDEDCCCLLEAASLPASTLPAPGVERTDHPPDVCSVRAQFGRSLNDAYGRGREADIKRTRDLWPLVDALRGTAARNDSDKVAVFLATRALKDWYPRFLVLYARILREEGSVNAVAAAEAIDKVVERLRTLEIRDGAALAALADLAARAALADEIKQLGRDLRKEMAAALLETCASGWAA